MRAFIRPFLVLAVRTAVEDGVCALDAGAGDYLVKTYVETSWRRVCARSCAAVGCPSAPSPISAAMRTLRNGGSQSARSGGAERRADRRGDYCLFDRSRHTRHRGAHAAGLGFRPDVRRVPVFGWGSAGGASGLAPPRASPPGNPARRPARHNRVVLAHIPPRPGHKSGHRFDRPFRRRSIFGRRLLASWDAKGFS
jgi:hypothetical protein